METPKEVLPNYRKPNLLMMEQSQTMQGHFSADKADFAKFTVFLDPYAANWQTAIDVADAMPDDDAVLKEIGLLTQDLEAEMKIARNFFGSLIIYVKQAYPDDAAVLQLFGEDRYKAAKNNQLKLIELMELVAGKANTQPYKAALIAKGFQQADITMLKTIELALRAKNKLQEAAISNRPFATQNRQLALNAVWDFALQVNEAAQSVYIDNYAKQQFYLLYPEDAGGTPPVTTVINLPTDQTTPGTNTVKVAGNASATGAEQLNLDHGDGYESVVSLQNGILTGYPHTYITAGQFDIQFTQLTPNAYGYMGVLQADNCMLYGTLSFPADFKPTGFQFPNNHVTHVDMQPASYSNMDSFIGFNNDIVVNDTNTILINLDNNGKTNGIVNLGGGTNAAPTGLGIAAKNSLIAKGWTVITN